MSDHMLGEIVRGVDERLSRLFDGLGDRKPDGLFPPPAGSPVMDQVRDISLRSGKRLRPALLVCGAELFEEGASEEAAVVDAAAALELMHVYFLIHDDIMDEDDVRRGGPSAHAALALSTGSEKLGKDLGILCGDMAMALHCELVAGMDAPRERVARAGVLFARMHRDVIHGQVMDLVGGTDPEEIALRKTASYTTVGPLAIGGALGGATEDRIRRLGEIGVPLGVAFQLRDDLLGIFGDPSVTGKPVGTDLERGKRTYIVEEALRRCTPSQREILDGALGIGPGHREKTHAAMEVLIQCGARDACEERISGLAAGAMAIIEEEEFLPAGRDLLIHIGNNLVKRRT